MGERVREPLAGLTVVEWSRSVAGAYAGRVLADAGARVVRFGADEALDGRERLAEYLHSGKAAGAGGVAAALAEQADVAILEFPDAPPPALLESAAAPVVAAVTPWGLRGPWAGTGRPWSELTLQAEAGALLTRGLSDREPVMSGSDECRWIAGSMAAGAVVAALHGGPRRLLLDVPLLEVTAYSSTMFQTVSAAVCATPRETPSARRRLIPSVEQAADGWVGFNLASAQNHLDFLVLIERPEWLDDPQMTTFLGRYERYDEFTSAVRAWTTRHTVAEIVELAGLFRIPCAPVHNGQTIAEDPQVVARGVVAPNPGGGFVEPAPPFRFGGERPVRTGAAPEPAARPFPRTPTDDLPLAGVRVLDLGTWWVGSYVGSALAALGADVVKVESTRRIDGGRTLGGVSVTQDHWWECGNIYLGTNSGTRNVTLDLTHAAGRELFVELLRGADVLIENYAPRVLESVGLGWAAAHELNPRLVLHRMPAFGLDGPRRDMVGYAQTVEQYSGLCWRTGYADGEPLNPNGPADPMGAANSLFALLAALLRARRTGIGELVESALAEAAIVMSAEQVVAFSADGTLLGRTGNRGARTHLQGVFAAAGAEQWLAVTVETEEQWAGLCKATGFDGWAADPQLGDAAGRRAAADRLEAELGEWAAVRPAAESADLLLAEGVPAAPARDPRFLLENPQLAARDHFVEFDLPWAGRVPLPQLPVRPAAGGWLARRRPPTLGEHNDEVLGGELGVSAERLAALAAERVVGTVPH